MTLAERPGQDPRRPLAGGYAWYYFDAISLDGRYALVITWHSGFLFSARYYDEVLELRARGGVQPSEGTVLADPTNYGAFGLALYDRGRVQASLFHEAPLVRSGSDPWFSALHAGAGGLGEPPSSSIGAPLIIRENKLSIEADGSYRIEFSGAPGWLRRGVEGSLKVRPLAEGSEVVNLGPEETEDGAGHAWQILASRTEVTGRIQWTAKVGSRARQALDFAGLGYVDRNAGRLPISTQVGRWLWGRFQGSEKTIAYYRLDPTDVPFAADETSGNPPVGRTHLFYGDRSGGSIIEGARIEVDRIRKNRWGMPHPLLIRGRGEGLSFEAPVVRDVDRSPFLVRCINRLTCEDPAMDGIVGMTECFLPARWDVPVYRLIARGNAKRGL